MFFPFYFALNTQQGGYMRITSLLRPYVCPCVHGKRWRKQPMYIDDRHTWCNAWCHRDSHVFEIHIYSRHSMVIAVSAIPHFIVLALICSLLCHSYSASPSLFLSESGIVSSNFVRCVCLTHPVVHVCLHHAHVFLPVTPPPLFGPSCCLPNVYRWCLI